MDALRHKPKGLHRQRAKFLAQIIGGNMDNRETAIDIYNRLNRWSHGALTDFAVGIIEDELDKAYPEGAENTDAQPKEDQDDGR